MSKNKQILAFFLSGLLAFTPSLSVMGATTQYVALNVYEKNNIEEYSYNQIREAAGASGRSVSEIWTGKVADTYGGGNGTAAEPYQIENGEQLAKLAEDTNSKGLSQNTYYILTKDIYLNESTEWVKWSEAQAAEKSWTPIGNSSANFCGNFDGNGHSIYGIYICSSDDYQGLFGYLNDTARIKNISVSCSYIQGRNYVGGVAGYIYAEGSAERIANCYNSATVCGSQYIGGVIGKIDGGSLFFTSLGGCSNAGVISGSEYVGGVLGQGFGNNTYGCYNIGAVTGDKWVGGVAGETYMVSGSWNKGTVTGKEYVGGVSGKMAAGGSSTMSYIDSCFNAGNIYGETYVGGITGHASAYSWAYTSTIANSYNVGDITATKNHAAGIAGYSAYNEIKNCYSAGEYYFSGGPNYSHVITTLKSASNLYYRSVAQPNNFPSYVTELEMSEMQVDSFVDRLNNGGTAWEKDEEGVNFGYPILTAIDYGKYVEKKPDYSDFNVYIYRADILHDLTDPSSESIKNILAKETPAQIFKNAMEDNFVFTLSTDAWKFITDFVDVADDPTTLYEIANELKNTYSAIILNALEESVSVEYIDDNYKDMIKNIDKVISTASTAIKSDYLIDIYDQVEFKNMSEDDIKKISEVISNRFKESHEYLPEAGISVKNLSKIMKTCGSIEDAVQKISSYIALSNESQYMKDVLRQVYSESLKTDNKDLQKALLDCVDIIDASTEELINKLCTEELTAVGAYVGKELIKKLWDQVKETIKYTHPAVAVLSAAFKVDKLVVNMLFNTDNIVEQKIKTCALVDIEKLIDSASKSLSDKYISRKVEATAGAYLSSVDLVFSIRDADVRQTYGFLKALNGEESITLLGIIKKVFNIKDHSELYATLREFQIIYNLAHESALTDWIYQLQYDYPDSGLYETYSYLLQEREECEKVKEYIAACPVDVYVYDSDNRLVAYYADGRTHCDGDVELTLIIDGDVKTVRIYNDAEYSIRYVGTDSGTMDLTFFELENEKKVHTVNYYDVELKKELAYMMENDELVEENTGNVRRCDYDSLSTTSEAHIVSIINGSLLRDDEIFKDAEVYPGEKIQINACFTDEKPFLYWKVDKGDVHIEDIYDISTYFVMGNEDVKITAVMKSVQDTNENNSGGDLSGGGRGSRGGNGSSNRSGVFSHDFPNSAETVVGTWVRDEIGWWLQKEDGSYPKNQWARIDGLIYRFDEKGYMMEGWLFLNDHWYYLVPDSGFLATGWLLIDRKWYYFNTDGSMAVGWFYDTAYQKWFYMDSSGMMMTGWQFIDNKWYYLNPISDGLKGIMLIDQWIDGYYVDINGAWTEEKKQQ